MALRKREVKKEEKFVWTYQGNRPVFLVPVEGKLQWLDSEGYHVGDPGVNEGSIEPSSSSKDDLAHILSELMKTSTEESMQTIEVLANEIQDYPAGAKVFYTYEENTPILEDELDDDEFETAPEVLESVMAEDDIAPVVEETPAVTKTAPKNDYTSVTRQALLHHLRKYKIKAKRGVDEPTLIEIIQFADSDEWDLVKSHEAVASVDGVKTSSPETPTSTEATQLVREVAKQMEQPVAVTSEPEIEVSAVEVTEEDFLSVGELMEKAKGYDWKFSLEEIEKNFEGQDLKVISAIYGSKDNEEIAFRLERNFDLTPTQIERLLDGFIYGSAEYPSLIELLMTSGIVS